MARVRATQTRIICQYRDAAGHRLPSRKTTWKEARAKIEADCPKCPEPEPEVVECVLNCHDPERVREFMAYGWNFCHQCGQPLREE